MHLSSTIPTDSNLFQDIITVFLGLINHGIVHLLTGNPCDSAQSHPEGATIDCVPDQPPYPAGHVCNITCPVGTSGDARKVCTNGHWTGEDLVCEGTYFVFLFFTPGRSYSSNWIWFSKRSDVSVNHLLPFVSDTGEMSWKAVIISYESICKSDIVVFIITMN